MKKALNMLLAAAGLLCGTNSYSSGLQRSLINPVPSHPVGNRVILQSRAEVMAAAGTSEIWVEDETFDLSQDVKGKFAGAAALYRTKRAGFGVNGVMTKTTDSNWFQARETGQTFESDQTVTETAVEPFAFYSAKHFTLGASGDFHEVKYKGDEDFVGDDLSLARPSAGAMVHNRKFEAGLSWYGKAGDGNEYGSTYSLFAKSYAIDWLHPGGRLILTDEDETFSFNGNLTLLYRDEVSLGADYTYTPDSPMELDTFPEIDLHSLALRASVSPVRGLFLSVFYETQWVQEQASVDGTEKLFIADTSLGGITIGGSL